MRHLDHITCPADGALRPEHFRFTFRDRSVSVRLWSTRSPSSHGLVAPRLWPTRATPIARCVRRFFMAAASSAARQSRRSTSIPSTASPTGADRGERAARRDGTVPGRAPAAALHYPDRRQRPQGNHRMPVTPTSAAPYPRSRNRLSSGTIRAVRSATISTPSSASTVPTPMRRSKRSPVISTPSAMVASGVINVSGASKLAS